MSPEPRRSASPPRSRSPVNQLQSPTAGTDSLKENLGAHQPPTFPWKTRPLTAGPKSRVAPSRSPTYRRPASSLQQRPSARPFSDLQPAPRQKTEISDGDYFGDNIISPWESDLPQTTFRASFFEKETLPEPHQNRPSTAHRSSPIDKTSSEDVLRSSSAAQRPYSAAVGHERHGRRGSWDYDLKNSEHDIRPRTATAVTIEGARINSKMDVVHRVRTENAWLREEMLKLKREVAYEAQLNHYRSNSLLHEKEALDARLEAHLSASQETLRQAQESMRQEQKKTEDALSMVKRREDLVHRIKGEAANKKLVVLCVCCVFVYVLYVFVRRANVFVCLSFFAAFCIKI
jgi:hypothetical protein